MWEKEKEGVIVDNKFFNFSVKEDVVAREGVGEIKKGRGGGVRGLCRYNCVQFIL